MFPLQKWKIAGITSIFLVLCSITTFSILGASEDSIREMVRVTARTSVVLFLLAFSASSMQVLFKSPLSVWMLSNRRYLGVSFAISHFTHLAYLFALAIWYPYPFIKDITMTTWIGGTTAYVFITGMTITSFPGPRKWLGQKKWDLMHTTGGYLVFGIFASSYVKKAITLGGFYIPLGVAIVFVFVIRMIRMVRNKKRLKSA